MKPVQVHLLITLLATAACAWLWGNTPYFPIEISRMAASCRPSQVTFAIGLVTVLRTLFRTQQLSLSAWALYVGLVCIAVPDTMHFTIHMIGVMIVLCGMLARCWTRGRLVKTYTAVAVAVHGIRVLIKLGAVVYAQQRDRDVWSMLLSSSEEIKSINFHGADPAVYGESASVVLFAFRISAVMQWFAFGLLLYVF
jgi:hypothetical protein